MKIIIDLNKAKEIAHDIRRAARNEKFAPLDIKATIPTEAVAAESVRQVIREEDALLQIHMDNASSAEELKLLLPE